MIYMHRCTFVSYIPPSYAPVYRDLPPFSSPPADHLSSTYPLTLRNGHNGHNHHSPMLSHPILQKNHLNYHKNATFHFISSNISQPSQASQLPNCSAALPKAQSQPSQSSQLLICSIILIKALSQASQSFHLHNFSTNFPNVPSQWSQSQAIR